MELTDETGRKMAAAFTAPFCALAQPGASSKPGKDQHVERHASVIGGLPLYLLRAAGTELQKVRERQRLARQAAPVEVTAVDVESDVSRDLRNAAEAAAAALGDREAEIDELQTRCAGLEAALELSKARLRNVTTGGAEDVLADTARRFAAGMTANGCRAVRAEREAAVLMEEKARLEQELRDGQSDLVKLNAAAGAFTLALLVFWANAALGGM